MASHAPHPRGGEAPTFPKFLGRHTRTQYEKQEPSFKSVVDQYLDSHGFSLDFLLLRYLKKTWINFDKIFFISSSVNQ